MQLKSFIAIILNFNFLKCRKIQNLQKIACILSFNYLILIGHIIINLDI